MLRKAVGAALVVLLSIISMGITNADEYYFRFNYSSHDELNKLTRIISIDNVKGDTVFAYANDDELSKFKMLGYDYQMLQHPGTLYRPRMTDSKDLLLDWNYYPTYTGYLTLMNQFEDDYPDLCQVENIGYSVEGRQLLFAKISANVNVEESEPEIMYSSTMHGDETTGYILMLHLIDYLLSNYGTDPQVTNLLNTTEIWINPNANPDGTYADGNNSVYGATRTNSNSVDLNRNFPDPDDGQHPDGNAWQSETVAMLDFFAEHNFIISANFHGGAEVVNYPWDTYSRLHADDNWWESISREYADSAQANSPSGYMTDLNNGITNGYAWYSVEGGRQDCLNYWFGCREATIELSGVKLIPESQLEAHWNYNKMALITYMEHVYYGIRGEITDAQTGMPIRATISVVGHDQDSSEVYSDPDHGDYYRMIEPGTYSLRFTAPGYITQQIDNVTVSSYRSTTFADVAMYPLSTDPLLAYVSNNVGAIDPGDNGIMKISLVNNGGGNAYGVMGTLSTADEYATITQDTSSYPTITALGGVENSISDFLFDVSSTCPVGHQVQFRLDITENGGYIDSMFFAVTVGLQLEDFETGDFTMFEWQNSGSANWTISTDSYEGAYSASSGTISHNQSSILYLQYEASNNDSISFYCKVSSEATFDSLKFYIDNVLKQGWSGEVGWNRVTYPVSEGNHTFKWEYMKDGSESDGSDRAWVDYIIFPSSMRALEIVTVSLPDWTLNYPYSRQLEADGGSGPRTWSDLNGDLDGTGLMLSTDGLLSGTPAVAGEINFTARVEDNVEHDDQVYQFNINPALQITNDSLPAWTAGYAYSEQLMASGGTGARSWSDLNGDLDGTGLTLSSAGVLSGTPVTGTISFTVRVVDGIGATNDRLYEFVINDALVITTTDLPDWTRGFAYAYQLESSGGTGALIWSDHDGGLAGFGLTVSNAGMVVGTPDRTGEVSFIARATDGIGAHSDYQFEFTINVAIDITTDSLPIAEVNQPYSYQLNASGGTGALIWFDRENSLEGSGITLSESGLLSGTSASGISLIFVAKAQDEIGASKEKWFTLRFESSFLPGDANGDGRVVGGDVTYLVQYFLGRNDGPSPRLAGDANGDCNVNGMDVTYLVNFFRGVGHAPIMGDCPPILRKYLSR